MVSSKALILFSAPKYSYFFFFFSFPFFPEGDLSCPFPQEMCACVCVMEMLTDP